MNLRVPALRAAALLLLGLALAPGCASRPARTRTPSPAGAGAAAPTVTAGRTPAPEPGFVPLFPTEGVPTNWIVRGWSDITQPAPPEALWTVRDGTLLGSVPRGTWLVSEQEYGDFVLEFEIRLGARGNSGVAVRVPPQGDPSFEGLEIQLADPRFYGTNANTTVVPWDLPGAVFKALAPSAHPYRPEDWNHCRVECRGSRLQVVLNGRMVIETDLARNTTPLPRGRPLAERPARGRLAFQELSRDAGQVRIRNARIRSLD